jgi:hypothetical protein
MKCDVLNTVSNRSYQENKYAALQVEFMGTLWVSKEEKWLNLIASSPMKKRK